MANHEEHERREGHEAKSGQEGCRAGERTPSPWLRMRLPSPLSPEAELVMTETIGAAIAVHRELGPGFMETIYHRAMLIELQSRRLTYESERPIKVVYRGVEIPGQRIDLIVERLIIVEIKAVARLDRVHDAQLISYLKTTGLRGGLLINFSASTLRQGLRRIVV